MSSLFEIAKLVDGTIIGDGNITVSNLSPIDNISAGTLVFAEGKENIAHAESSQAAAILVNNQIESSEKPLIQVAHPLMSFIQLLHYFYPQPKLPVGVHPTVVLGENVTLGVGVYIGAYVTIGSGSVIGAHSVIKEHVSIGQAVKIGDHCTLYPHVTIYDNCLLGSQVIIHAGSVVGSDGFGYTFHQGMHVKIPHVGHVRIADNVEIGANTVIDKATLGETVIGEGTKIDNLVQIAHSVKLGKHNILCAFTGIAGSSTSGDSVIFAANVGVSDHVRIDDGVVLGARAGVPPRKHLISGNIYLGNPARPKDKAIEQELSVTRIPFMHKNLRKLSDKVAELNKKIDQMEAE